MSYECIYCNFSAPTNTRLKRHLSTQKHARNVLLHNKDNNVQEETKQIVDELIENVQEIQNEVLDKEENIEEEKVELCRNTDCERYPPDWDFEEDTEETYEEGEWKKCILCPGYFNDDGLGDILFIEEEPNNKEAGCDLCGKTQNIVQMKGTGQYICTNACDESEEEESVQENEEVNNCDECDIELDRYRDGSTGENIRCNNCYWEDKEGKDSNNMITPDYRKEKESVQEGDREKMANCDFCCEDKSFETYYTVKRGRQIYFSCNDCWENREKEIVAYSAYTWEKSVFPGPAFFSVEKEDVQEQDTDEVEENAENEVPVESFFLDIEYIKMINSMNELITTHPFILQIVGFLMNIVKWFGFPTRNKGT